MLHQNAPDRGSHVANALYVVAQKWRGQGIGERLVQDSLSVAERLGFEAIQFNSVVSSNTPSVRLWQKLGFTRIGEVPGAFRNIRGEKTSILIFYRDLQTV